MKTALLRYRVMANIVGVLLIVLVLVGLPLNELHRLSAGWFPVGTTAQSAGAWISKNLGVAHGWLYMIFLVMAFLLSRKAKWDLRFTAITLLCGTVPILSFWAEHRATRQVRAKMVSTTASTHGGQSGGEGLTVDGTGSAATKERSRLGGPSATSSPNE